MTEREREAIEEAIDLLEREVRYNGKGFWIGSVYVSQDDDITEAIRMLKGIVNKGEKEMIKKYVKRNPGIVRAIQFTGENATEILNEFFSGYETFSAYLTFVKNEDGRRVKELTIRNYSQESCILSEGDYIVKTMSGEPIAHEKDEFKVTYTEV